MIAKSKVPPVKMQTIPRFELTGAVLSVKVAGLLQEELEIPIKVLSDRLTRSCWGIFPTLVLYHVKFIREDTELTQ